MQTERQRKLDIGCAALFAVVFSVMFLFSLWTPLIADDYNYAFGYSTGTRGNRRAGDGKVYAALASARKPAPDLSALGKRIIATRNVNYKKG